MSTRGIVIRPVDGKFEYRYNHYDSYLEHLQEMLNKHVTEESKVSQFFSVPYDWIGVDEDEESGRFSVDYFNDDEADTSKYTFDEVIKEIQRVHDDCEYAYLYDQEKKTWGLLPDVF